MITRSKARTATKGPSSKEMSDTVPFRSKLPVELLRLVKDHVPVSDLRTHVCYYNTCRTTASFYGAPAQQEAFFKQSCTLCGICLLGDESWKDVAFECISEDGFCSHPFCGGALLDWNVQQVSEAVERIPQWKPEKPLNKKTLGLRDDQIDLQLDQGQVVPHSIFEYIGFSSPGSEQADDSDTDAYLRYHQGIVAQRSALYEHPVARRSSAVFPSFSLALYWGVGLDDSQIGTDVMNAPVTVWDVQNTIRDELSGGLSHYDFHSLVQDRFPYLTNKHERSQSESTAKITAPPTDGHYDRTYRDIWSKCRFVITVGNVFIGDLGDLTVNLVAALMDRKAGIAQ